MAAPHMNFGDALWAAVGFRHAVVVFGFDGWLNRLASLRHVGHQTPLRNDAAAPTRAGDAIAAYGGIVSDAFVLSAGPAAPTVR